MVISTITGVRQTLRVGVAGLKAVDSIDGTTGCLSVIRDTYFDLGINNLN